MSKQNNNNKKETIALKWIVMHIIRKPDEEHRQLFTILSIVYRFACEMNRINNWIVAMHAHQYGFVHINSFETTSSTFHQKQTPIISAISSEPYGVVTKSNKRTTDEMRKTKHETGITGKVNVCPKKPIFRSKQLKNY